MDIINWNGDEEFSAIDAAAELPASNENRAPAGRCLSGRQLCDEFLAALELDRTSPLLTVDVSSTPQRLDVTLYDRAHSGFDYEFSVKGLDDALNWVAHLAQKSWITTEHLERFARAARNHFHCGKDGA